MLKSTANIYVSIGQALPRDSESDDSQYHRQRHRYLISVEPHRLHIPGLPQHAAKVTHFEAVKDDSGSSFGLARYSSRTAPGIIGNILIAASANTTPDKVEKILSNKLASPAARDDSFGDNEDEHVVRLFLHALRDTGLTTKFNIDEFIMWTHSYIMDRLNNEAPSLVAYPRAHKDYAEYNEQKSWTVQPAKKRQRTDRKILRANTL